jgi:hypothetical protein
MDKQTLPSSWQLGDKVQVVFPGNGKLQGKIIQVSFTEYGETRYNIEIPFDHTDYDEEQEAGRTGYFRIHGVDQYFISYTQEEWDKIRAEEKAV